MKAKIIGWSLVFLLFLSIVLSVFGIINTFIVKTDIKNSKNKDLEVETIIDKVSIDPFFFPLPIKYLDNVSSNQGLRNPLSESEAGSSTSGKWHNGFDIVCPDKTPVYAAKDGIVTTVYPSFYNDGKLYQGHNVYGGLIIINHFDSTITLYAHLSKTLVVENQEVKTGELIGLSGGKKGRRGSGTSTGPHLHFSIYIDMESFMNWSEGKNYNKNIDRIEVKDGNYND